MFGLCGAHRVGKTTLAKTFAEMTGLPFVQTNVVDTFLRMGLDPQAEYEFGERLEIQQEIMTDLHARYLLAPKRFVTDRTPMDVFAYTLADVRRGSLTEWMEQDLEALWKYAMRITLTHLSMVALIQPGIPLVDNPLKAQASTGYIEHINSILIGLLMSKMGEYDELAVIMLKREALGLHERTQLLLGFVNEYFPDQILLQSSCPLM